MNLKDNQVLHIRIHMAHDDGYPYETPAVLGLGFFLTTNHEDGSGYTKSLYLDASKFQDAKNMSVQWTYYYPTCKNAQKLKMVCLQLRC